MSQKWQQSQCDGMKVFKIIFRYDFLLLLVIVLPIVPSPGFLFHPVIILLLVAISILLIGFSLLGLPLSSLLSIVDFQLSDFL